MGCIHIYPLTFRGLSLQTLPLCSVQLHVSWNPEASPGLCIFSYRIKYTQVLSADGTVPFQAPKEATCLIPKSCQQPATSRCLIIEDSSNKKPCNSQESAYSLTSERGWREHNHSGDHQCAFPLQLDFSAVRCSSTHSTGGAWVMIIASARGSDHFCHIC